MAGLDVRDDEELAMDCELARERLDAARPDARDREDSELQAAFAHLDECDACAEAIETCRAIDRRLGEVIRQVQVPHDLKSRLHETLAAAGTHPQPDLTATAVGRPMRRALILAASAATLFIAAGVSWYVGSREPAPLAAADVFDWWRSELSQPDFNLQSLPEFDGEFDALVADGRWRQLAIDPPRGADIDHDGAHDAAVFTIPGGFLVVLEPDRVSDPPVAKSPGNAAPVYSPAPHVAWTVGRSMHICFLPGGAPSQLQMLLRKIYSPAA